MLASDNRPLVGHCSQESEIGEKHGLDIEICEFEHLFDDIENCVLIDNYNLLNPFDPFLERQSFAEVINYGNQDPNRFDDTTGSKSDEDAPAFGTEHNPSRGIDLNDRVETVSGIHGGPEITVTQILDRDAHLILLNCPDQSNEVGTYVHNSSGGKPFVLLGPGPVLQAVMFFEP